MSGFRRVIAGVSGSPGCLPALRYAADMARSHDAALIPVLAWVPPGGEFADRGSPSPYLRQLCGDAARQRLRDALDTAFGGTPAGVRTEPLVRRGEPGRILVSLACEPDDLLVIGRGRRTVTGRLLHRGVSHYCLARACCPVLAVPPSALEQEAGHGLRGWAFRHRGLRPDKISSPASR